MKLLNKKSLKQSKESSIVEELLKKVEFSINRWQSFWSPFLAAPIRDEIINLVKPINYIECFSSGGFKGAERHRIYFSRNITETNFDNTSEQFIGMNIEGNFLFDKAKIIDFQNLLETLGAETGDIGDIWLTGDRGAQIICKPETAEELNGKKSSIRDVEIICKKLEIDQLQIPRKRIPKIIKTVEASTRIDAISSAGFGLSRAKIVNKIKEGQMRLNWEKVSNTSKALIPGDQINLDKKGSLKILRIEATHKKRWKVELLRE